MTDYFDTIRQHVEDESALAVVTVIKDPRGAGARMLVWPDGSTEGSLGDSALEAELAPAALEQLARGVCRSITSGEGDREVIAFIDVYPAPNRLHVFGGNHIAVPLVELAKVMGFRAVVVDVRGRFASESRFPNADELHVTYADEYLRDRKLGQSDYVVVLTHDPKLDDPALIHATRSDARYIGAIGSRRTHAKRVERLVEAGLGQAELDRIHAPIGLDIDAQNPEEIAMSIMAEVIAAKNGKDGKITPVRLAAAPA
jgi:xanthine dehydrogenase accessory factor